MATILTNQKYAMINLVKSLTKLGGYNFDWDTVNQLEYNIGTFPRVFCMAKKEDNLDSRNGLGSNDYTNRVFWEIHIVGMLSFPSDNPMFDIDDVLFPALDDLKKIMGCPTSGVGYNLNGTCDSFLYRGFENDYASKDQFIPRDMITKWEAVYSVDRTNPTRYAGS